MKKLKEVLETLIEAIPLIGYLFIFGGVIYGFIKTAQNGKQYDLNNDGIVSIRDVWTCVWEMFKGPGRVIQEFIATHFETVGHFLEMSTKEPSTLWSCIFTVMLIMIVNTPENHSSIID